MCLYHHNTSRPNSDGRILWMGCISNVKNTSGVEVNIWVLMVGRRKEVPQMRMLGGDEEMKKKSKTNTK